MGNEVKRLRWISFLLALVLTVVLVASAVSQYTYMASFQPIQATLVQIGGRYGTTSSTRMTLYKTAYYEYTVEGKSYISPQEILPISFRKVGSVYSVRYNPDDPAELQDSYEWYTTIAAAAVLAAVSIGLGKLLLKDAGKTFRVKKTRW